jgi:hypothetical protein
MTVRVCGRVTTRTKPNRQPKTGPLAGYPDPLLTLSIHDKDLDDYLSTIRNNYNDRRDDISESNDQPARRPSRNAMGKRPSKDSFTSTLGKQVAATELSLTSEQPLHSEHWDV